MKLRIITCLQMQSKAAPTYGTFNSNTDDGATLNTISTADTASSNLQTTSSGYNTTSSGSTSRSPSASGAEPKRKPSGDLSANATWKAAFVVNGCRVFFLFLFSGLLLTLDSGLAVGRVFSAESHQAFLDAWNLSDHVHDSTFTAFGLGLGAGVLAYFLAFAACHMNMAVGALAPPLLLSTPLCLAMVMVGPVCEGLMPSSTCDGNEKNVWYVVAAAACLLVGHLLAFGWYLFRTDPVLLQQESLVSECSA